METVSKAFNENSRPDILQQISTTAQVILKNAHSYIFLKLKKIAIVTENINRFNFKVRHGLHIMEEILSELEHQSNQLLKIESCF